MTARHAGKYRLLPSGGRWKGIKAPHCSQVIAKRYRRSQGLKEREIWAVPRRDSNAAAIHRCLSETFRPITPVHSHGVIHRRCDKYLADAVFRWLRSCCRSPDSWGTYAKAFSRWLYHRPADRRPRSPALHVQLATRGAMVVGFLRQLQSDGCGARTMALHRDVLRSWFRWLYEAELIDRRPITREAIECCLVRIERVQRGPGIREALTAEQAQVLANWALAEAEPEVGFGALLQCVGGLRAVEVERSLRRRQIETPWAADPTVVRMGLVVEGKGGKQRIIVYEDALIAAWQRLERERRLSGTRGQLIPKPGGGAYKRRTIYAWAKRALAVAGRPDLSSHDLRRTACTLLVENGATLEQACGVLGHARLDTTRLCYVARPKPLTATTGIKVPA